jgi:hypothetical protein
MSNYLQVKINMINSDILILKKTGFIQQHHSLIIKKSYISKIGVSIDMLLP